MRTAQFQRNGGEFCYSRGGASIATDQVKVAKQKKNVIKTIRGNTGFRWWPTPIVKKSLSFMQRIAELPERADPRSPRFNWLQGKSIQTGHSPCSYQHFHRGHTDALNFRNAVDIYSIRKNSVNVGGIGIGRPWRSAIRSTLAWHNRIAMGIGRVEYHFPIGRATPIWTPMASAWNSVTREDSINLSQNLIFFLNQNSKENKNKLVFV